MTGKCKRKLALIDAVEQEARKRGKRVCREYRVVTPRLDAVMDLLVSDESHRTAYQAEDIVDLVGWNMLKAQAARVDELQILFPSDRLARIAQKLADDLKASGRASDLSVLCVTAPDAVQRLRDGNGVGVEVNPPSPFAPGSSPQQLKSNVTILTDRRGKRCKFAI